MNTCPTFKSKHLIKYMSKPTESHFKTAFKIIRYLKGAQDQGIFYKRDNNLQLNVYTDIDWTSCPQTRRSVSGYTFLLLLSFEN